MLGRRNIAYGALGLFTLSDHRPIRFDRAFAIPAGSPGLQAAAIQPDHTGDRGVATRDAARHGAVAGLQAGRFAHRQPGRAGLILASCIGSSFLTIYWDRDQFYLWQLLQAVGQPMVIMPLLMMATNAVAGPAEGPFASALINTSRAVAEATGAWLLELIGRWRNALHSDRIIDEIGQDRWRVIQGNGVLPQYPPPLMPDGQPRVPNSLETFSHAVEQQVTILSTSDTFLILGALTVFLMVVVMTLPIRTMPPRIQLAKHRNPHGRGCSRTRDATRRAEAERKAGSGPDARERRSIPTEGVRRTKDGAGSRQASRASAALALRSGRIRRGDLRRGGPVHNLPATPGHMDRRCLCDGPLRHDRAAHLRSDRHCAG